MKTAENSTLAVGATISHYRIVSKIGAGGMGEVYLAQDTKLDRKVAIKFLPESLVTDEQARKRLVREAHHRAAWFAATVHAVG
jgi:serine/threonine protein kinase